MRVFPHRINEAVLFRFHNLLPPPLHCRSHPFSLLAVVHKDLDARAPVLELSRPVLDQRSRADDQVRGADTTKSAQDAQEGDRLERDKITISM